MVEHTPGPWRDMGFGGVGAKGTTDTYAGPVWGTIAMCKDTQHTDAEGRTWSCAGDKEANARLIAAAPDLLAALERALIQMCVNINDTEMAVIDAACAAIAKARNTAKGE